MTPTPLQFLWTWMAQLLREMIEHMNTVMLYRNISTENTWPDTAIHGDLVSYISMGTPQPDSSELQKKN